MDAGFGSNPGAVNQTLLTLSSKNNKACVYNAAIKCTSKQKINKDRTIMNSGSEQLKYVLALNSFLSIHKTFSAATIIRAHSLFAISINIFLIYSLLYFELHKKFVQSGE